MRVTVEIELNDDYVETVSEADHTINQLLIETMEASESVVTWDVVKVERS